MKVSAELQKLFKEYGGDPKTDLWDCHGKTIAMHSWLEKVAAKSGIRFEIPAVIESDASAKTVAICVHGTLGERMEWSFGEAAPYNNKNGYPFAMSEKRAKDRVTLKLLNLHGEVYSEEEADDFKTAGATKANSRELYTQLETEIRTVGNAPALETWGFNNKERIGELHSEFQTNIRAEYKRRLGVLKAEKETA